MLHEEHSTWACSRAHKHPSGRWACEHLHMGIRNLSRSVPERGGSAATSGRPSSFRLEWQARCLKQTARLVRRLFCRNGGARSCILCLACRGHVAGSGDGEASTSSSSGQGTQMRSAGVPARCEASCATEDFREGRLACCLLAAALGSCKLALLLVRALQVPSPRDAAAGRVGWLL